ncbi:MAG: efflux RND transporter periplasmic adaptor subunit [Planctomycetota bacterium]|jgi:RND family efflux transporter MFP subunit|nr:efflux RND transporter periplasmic adaptor subunit [Planctomycetota bacterium]
MIRNTIICSTAIVAVSLSACGGGGHPPAASQAELPPISATSVVVQRDERPRFAPVVATVAARNAITVMSKHTGTILELPVRLSQQVAAGEVLVRVEAAALRARRAQAVAQHKQAQQELTRVGRLIERGAATAREQEAAQAQAQIAEQAVMEIDAMLADTEITAPFAGVVTARLAEVGELAMPGRPLLELADPSTLELSAPLPETVVSRLRVGAILDVVDADAVLLAKITEIAPSADSASRTVQVKAALPEDHGLRLGQFVRLHVPAGTDEVITVPGSAIIKQGQLRLVAVVQDGRVQLRLVRVGRPFGERIEVVAGIAPGEQILDAPPANLRDGQAVTSTAGEG